MYKTLYSQIYTDTKQTGNGYLFSSFNFKMKDVYVRGGQATKPVDCFIDGKPALDFGKGNIVTLPGVRSLIITNTDNLPAEYTMHDSFNHREHTFRPKDRTDNFVKEVNYISGAPEPIHETAPIHESVKAPEPVKDVKPMTDRQSYALYLISGRDWRKSSVKLSIIQASCLIRAGNALKQNRKAA